MYSSRRFSHLRAGWGPVAALAACMAAGALVVTLAQLIGHASATVAALVFAGGALWGAVLAHLGGEQTRRRRWR